MIFDVMSQPLVRRIQRRPFRHRPRDQHPFDLQPEVEVQVGGVVSLHHEPRLVRAPAATLPGRLAGLGGVTLAAISLQLVLQDVGHAGALPRDRRINHRPRP
jgi:hypothetical protein